MSEIPPVDINALSDESVRAISSFASEFELSQFSIDQVSMVELLESTAEEAATLDSDLRRPLFESNPRPLSFQRLFKIRSSDIEGSSSNMSIFEFATSTTSSETVLSKLLSYCDLLCLAGSPKSNRMLGTILKYLVSANLTINSCQSPFSKIQLVKFLGEIANVACVSKYLRDYSLSAMQIIDAIDG